MNLFTLKLPLPNFSLLCVILLFSLPATGQVNLQVTINDGTSTTTCTDNFGVPDPHWKVLVGGGNDWVTYPATTFCYQDPPFLQYNEAYTCPSDLPNTIEVCLRVFEDDGSFCTPSHSCSEIICQNFPIPQVGQSVDHSLALATGLSSWGEIDFTIAVTNNNFGPPNDFVCDAIDLGVLPFGGTIGDASLSNYTNICATNVSEPNPSSVGNFQNEQAVWFTFTTSESPTQVDFNAMSDPQNFGDPINLQMALYESDDGTCNGNLSAVFYSSVTANDYDEFHKEDCLLPNTTYFLLVDGSIITSDGGEGIFGLEITDVGVNASADLPCDAYDFGPIPDGGSFTLINESNICASHIFGPEPNTSAFVPQRTVWYTLEVPASGHLVIETVSSQFDPIGLQIGVFSSWNNSCTGFFSEITTHYTFMDLDETLTLTCLEPGEPIWILIDGDGNYTIGVYDITISDGGFLGPQSTTELNPVLCNGGDITIGGTVFDTPGPFEVTVDAYNNCDSLIFGEITILPPLSSSIDTTICFGQSITVGTSTYTTTGNFTDVITNYAGCDSIVTTSLTVTAPMDATATQTIEATNYQIADGAATVVASGGAGGFTYLWSDGQTTPTATNLLGGTNYCVTITDAEGCTVEDCVLILFPSNILTNLENVLLDCPGDTDGALSLTISNGAAPYAYDWENLSDPTINGTGSVTVEGGTATISNLVVGMYSFTISDAFGLTIAVGTVLEPAPIFTNINPTICDGEIISVGNANYSATGPISEVLTSYLGCDSTVNGFLTVLDPIQTSIDETLCFGESLTVGNVIYDATGPVNEVLTSYLGCDSMVLGHVTILPENTTSIDTTVCFGEPVVITDIAYGQSGIYTEVIPAFNGCDSTITLDLTVLEELFANATLVAEATGPGLFDGTAQANPVGGSGNYTYVWSDGQTTQIANNLLAGEEYCVNVIDDLGCSAQSCVVIDFISNIEVSVVNDTLDCFGDLNGFLFIDIELGLAPYTYNWQNQDNSLNGSGTIDLQNGDDGIIGLPPGTYLITVADDWGEATTQALVVEPAELEAITATSGTSCFEFCDGGASVTASGGTPPYQYLWPTGDASAAIVDICAGDYVVTVTDSRGCTLSLNATVNQPEELIVTTNLINAVSCFGESDGQASASINGTTQSYLWDNGETTAIASNLAAGVHTVVVTDNTGCSATGSIQVNEPDDPVQLTLNTQQDVSCYGGEDGTVAAIVTGGSEPYDYEWSHGATTAVANNLIAGPYSLTVVDANGCSVEAATAITQPTEIVANLAATEVTCPEGENSGSIQVLSASGGGEGFIYALDGINFSTDTFFNQLTADIYTVSVQDVEGCIVDFQIEVEAPDEVILDLGDDREVELGESIDINPTVVSQNLLFEWVGLQPGDCLNCSSVQTTPTGNTVVQLTVTDTISGCSVSDQITVRTIDQRDVYIPSAFSPNGDGANDYFYVNAGPEVLQVNSLRVYNRWGALMYEARNVAPNDFQSGWNGRFKDKSVDNGVYIYVAEVTFIDGLVLLYEGDVTVLK